MKEHPLEEWIINGDTGAVKQHLEDNPADVTLLTSYGISPLMLACYYQQSEIADLLKGLTPDMTLFEAAATGKFDVLAHKIYQEPSKINDYSPDGFTALGIASYFGREEAARYLVLKGADVNLPSVNGFGVYPLHAAVAGNHNAIVRMLLENDAKVNVTQQLGITPLHNAAQNGNIEMIILLLEKGAVVDTRMEGGKLPADLAREKGFREIADILS